MRSKLKPNFILLINNFKQKKERIYYHDIFNQLFETVNCNKKTVFITKSMVFYSVSKILN